MEDLRPTRKMNLLLGFLLKGEADAIFKQNPFEIPEDNGTPIDLWRRSAEGISGLPFTPQSVEIEILDNSASEVVNEVKSRPTYRKHYESIADYQFCMVPVNALLTPQWLADIDYIEELATRITSSASVEEQIQFAMAEGAITEPIIAGPHVIFTSQSRNLHAEQIPSVRKIGDGEFEIVIRASSRPNYIQAAKIGNRLLLTNGVHKVCALQINGYTHVPCVLRQISRIEESGLNLQTSLFRPDLIGGVRPAQVIDFLNTEVAVPVLVRSMNQVLRVGIGVEVLQVPAVPPAVTNPTQGSKPNLGIVLPSDKESLHTATRTKRRAS